MPFLAASIPFENIEDRDEQKVLALADHLLPLLDAWRSGEELSAEKNRLMSQISDEQEKIRVAREENETLSALLKKVFMSRKSWGYLGPGLIIFGLVSIFFDELLISLFIVATGLFWSGKSIWSEKKSLNERIASALAKVDLSTANVASLQGQVSRILSEIDSRAISFPVIRIGMVGFDLVRATLPSTTLIIDSSDILPTKVLKISDTSKIGSDLVEISDKLKSIVSVPTMLVPREGVEIDDPLHEVFGEEEELQNLVSDFTRKLGQVEDTSIKGALISPDSFLGRRIVNGELWSIDFEPIRIAKNVLPSSTEFEAFSEALASSRSAGASIISDLRSVYSDLENACSLYSRARTQSVNVLHQNLLEVLNRAAWCSRRFYCPRSILSTEYIQDLVGVSIDKAHLLSLDDLIEKLHSDPEISLRLKSKPEIESKLINSYIILQDLMGGIELDIDGNRLINSTARPRHIEDQYQQSLKLFKKDLHKALTGADYEFLNFSREAQVYFDPLSDQWSSEMAPYEYSTEEILRFGSVPKVHSDLMTPLWEHLWTEKADFRKSEQFRTNESLIRMSEKESEKLIGIGNQFKADFRAVRENVYKLEAELKSKFEEIIGFRDGMASLNLLSDRVKQNVSDERLEALNHSEMSLPAAERYETMLGGLPQSQTEARGTVHDPINLVRSTDSLVGYERQIDLRLTNSSAGDSND